MQSLSHAVAEVIDRSSLERKLRSGKKLRIKLGVDPSSPDLHLGHFIVLRQLRQFADAGHKVIFLIGDYTARIGDPSGRNSERPVLTLRQIKNNVKTYIDQVALVLDPAKIEVRYNSEWYDKISFADWLAVLHQFSVNYIFERDDFALRIKNNQPLGMHEVAYPIMQAYDSIKLKADVELGGTDQKFNLLAGRALQRKMGEPEQDIITMHLLVGIDGKKKMSKSIGNIIGLTDSAEDIFCKVMSIPDEVTKEYAQYLLGKTIGELSKEVGSDHPMQIKQQLASEIVSLLHPGSAQAAAAHFDRVFREKKAPVNIKVVSVGSHHENLRDLLVEEGLVASTTELIKLVKQGAVKMDGKLIKEEDVRGSIPKGEHDVRIGSRRFVKVINK